MGEWDNPSKPAPLVYWSSGWFLAVRLQQDLLSTTVHELPAYLNLALRTPASLNLTPDLQLFWVLSPIWLSTKWLLANPLQSITSTAPFHWCISLWRPLVSPVVTLYLQILPPEPGSESELKQIALVSTSFFCVEVFLFSFPVGFISHLRSLLDPEGQLPSFLSPHIAMFQHLNAKY